MKVLMELDGDEEFIEYLHMVHDKFHIMINTIKDFAELIKAETLPRTPLETGRLGESFDYIVLEDTPRQKMVQIRMSALNPRTGYDYSAIQHFHTGYSHAHGQAFYLRDGIQASESMGFMMVEQDYMSLFRGGA